MRATWITSLIAGALFGGAAGTVAHRDDAISIVVILAVFLPSTLFGVFGVGQMKEMLEERKRRGLGFFGVLAEGEDFKKFYLPTWGRMLVWLFATGAGAVVTQGLMA